MTEGVMSPLACTLRTSAGRIFVKGTPVDAPAAWMYRAEAQVTHAASLAPSLLWEVEAGGWLLCGYEFLEGRHPDLSPGSGDLTALVDTLRVMSGTPWPAAVRKKPLAARWGNLAPAGHADDLAGHTLAHTDMSPLNMLRTAGGIRLVDWALACPAPAWADTAFTVPRLIHAGHTADQAESIARLVPAYEAAPEGAVSAFARSLYSVWESRERTDPLPHRSALTEAARAWTGHRSVAV
ncbi:aminoglycoside phosphotransferase [Streptomyces sp. NPDC056244]|uniref:aminoglycoside phosphotransferase n=1 Tax=Streptomyces sp. NPDC056244 TaxID=3345762 RepID=UPI0035DDDD7A